MEALFYSMLLTCADAHWIAEGAMNAVGLDANERIEIVQRVFEQTDTSCEMGDYTINRTIR